MKWTAYRLVYQAKSPIHIGWHTLGYIKLTRYYITGKSMWGAMTANLARVLPINKKLDEHYKEIGNILMNRDILVSYFYPALDPDMPLLPRFTQDGLKYGECTASEFERLFIKSYGQTAVLPESNTAEDETLHESEYIASIVEDNKPVCFVGYVFINDDAKNVDDRTIGWDDKDIRLKDIVKEIFVGGDRKYGWGRLALDSFTTANDMFDFKVDKFPEITIPAGKPIPAHLVINDDLKLKGDIEPLVGREWGDVKDKMTKLFARDSDNI